MIEAFQFIKEALEEIAPSTAIQFVNDLHDANSTRCVQSGMTINLSVSEWKTSLKDLGQQGGYRVWNITIESSRRDALENRWMTPSPLGDAGIYDIAKAIREALSGLLLPNDSSPLLPLSGKVLPAKGQNGRWVESFAEYLRPTDPDQEFAVLSLSSGNLIVSPPNTDQHYIVLENTDGINVGSEIYASNLAGALQFLGTVESKTSTVLNFLETVAFSPAIGKRVYFVTQQEGILPFPALVERDTKHSEFLRTLSGRLIQSTLSIPSETVDRVYAPLNSEQLLFFKQAFNSTAFLNAALLKKGTDLFLEVYDQAFQVKPIDIGLWALICKGKRTALYDPDPWAILEVPE